MSQKQDNRKSTLGKVAGDRLTPKEIVLMAVHVNGNNNTRVAELVGVEPGTISGWRQGFKPDGNLLETIRRLQLDTAMKLSRQKQLDPEDVDFISRTLRELAEDKHDRELSLIQLEGEFVKHRLR